MKEEQNKLILPILITITIIIIIIIAIILISNKNKEDITNIVNNTLPENENNATTEQIEIINKNDNIEDFEQNANISKNNKYIDMTEENYKKYNTDEQTFRIQDVVNNNNGTMTIKGRVYKYIKIPRTLTKEQYDSLVNGSALKILGEKATKIEDDTKAQEAGYDICLKIESKEHKYEMLYYVQKNADGTGTLYEGSEANIADGTDIYMQITLDENTICQNGRDKTTLKEYFSKGYHIENKNRTRLILKTAEFEFENGKCISIDLSDL